MQYINEKAIRQSKSMENFTKVDLEEFSKKIDKFLKVSGEKINNKTKREKYADQLEEKALDIAVYLLRGDVPNNLVDIMFDFNVTEFNIILNYIISYIDSVYSGFVNSKKLRNRIINGTFSINLQEVNGITPKNIPLSALNF